MPINRQSPVRDEDHEKPRGRKVALIDSMKAFAGITPRKPRRETFRRPLGIESLEPRTVQSATPFAEDIVLMDDLHTYEAEMTEIVSALVSADPAKEENLMALKTEAHDLITAVLEEPASSSLPVDSAVRKQTSDIPGSLAEFVHPGTGTAFKAQVDRQGKWIYTSAGKGPVQKMNALTGALEPITFTGHTGLVTTLSISPDGSKLATGSHDRTVRIYDTATGAMIGSFPVGSIADPVRFLEDGKRVATIGYATDFSLYSLDTKTVITKPVVGDTFVVAIGKDMKRSISAHSNGIVITDMASGAERNIALKNGGGSMVVSDDNATAFYASGNNLFAIDLTKGTISHSFSGLGQTTSIATSGSSVAVGNYGGIARILEYTTSGFVVRKEHATGRPVYDVNLIGSSLIALASNDGTGNARIVRYEGVDQAKAQKNERDAISTQRLAGIETTIKDIATDVAKAQNTPSIASPELSAALTDQALLQMMLDEEHSTELLTNRSWGSSLMIASQNVTSAGVAPSGDTLAVGKSDGTLAFYTAGTGVEQTEKALNIGAPITSLKYMSNGNLVVTTAKSFRVIDASGATVKTVNYTQDISKMNAIDNGFFVFVYASAGLPSSVMLYDQKGEQTYKKDISPNVGVVSVTADGSTMIHGYPSGASAIPITAQGKSIGLDFSNSMGRGSGTVGSAEINADGTGRFMFAYQNGYGTSLVVTDATGKTLVPGFGLGMTTAVQNIVSLGGGRFLVDTLQDVTADAGRSRQTRIFKYELGVLKEEALATKQGGYKYSPLSVSADMTTAVTSQYDSVIVGSLPSAVADAKALQDGAKKIGPAVISSAQLDNSLGKNLVNGQRADLVGLAQTYSALTTLKYNNTMIFQKFLATFADWRDENAVTTANAKGWSLDYFYYARGQEFESFNKDIGSYDDALGRMMEAGMNAVLADVRFQDPTSALTSLRAIPKDPIYGSTLAHIARIGIVLPTEAQIISACKAILIKGSDAYQDMQGIYRNRTENAVRTFNSNNYTDYVQPAPTVPETTFDRKAWLAAMEITDKLAKMEMARNAQPMPAGAEVMNIASSLSPEQIVSAMKGEISALLAQGKTMESILRDLQMQSGGQSLQALEREKVRVGNDVVTKMNRASLEALKATAQKALPNATIRSAEAEILHWTIMLEATNGLLGLIPAGGTEPDFTKDPNGEIWRRVIERNSTDPYEMYAYPRNSASLGNIGVVGSCIQPLDLEIAPQSNGEVTFTLKGDMMVNFYVDVNDVEKVSKNTPGALAVTPDFSLALTGTTAENKTVSWSNPKNGTSAETVSGRLPAGTYTLTLTNNSQEKPANGGFYPLAAHPFVNFRVHADIKPFDSRKIEGKVSIEGSPVSMPVSMSVAEFDTNGDRRASDKVSALRTDLPVWVVVHGRDNSENSSQIAELTRNLKALGVQVVTINWEEAAKDNLTKIGLEGSKWIENVGAWGANQLRSLGFNGNNINVIGHSWGSYVAYEIGANMSGGVKSLVALDPAADSRAIGGGQYKGFSDSDFKFSNVAGSSYAFHSSFYGNGKKAKTAEYSFDIVVPEGYENGQTFVNTWEKSSDAYMHDGLISEIRDELIDDPSREHGFAVSLFSSLLNRQKNVSNDPIGQMFTLSKLQTDTECFIRDGYEGVFSVDPMQYTNEIGVEAGKKSWQAKIFGFQGKDKDGNDIFYPRTL